MDELQAKIKEIQKCYQSEEYHRLKALQERKTLLDIFGKSRSETIHSSMIAWCFGNEEFNSTPVTSAHSLLRLAAINATIQASDISSGQRSWLMSDDLWNIIYGTGVKSLEVESVSTEEGTKSKISNGRTDIVVRLCINGTMKVRIVIENKVDSKEGINQCKKYFDYYNNLGDGYENVYLFLAPEKPEQLSSDNFIKITYQEFLDSVLYPMMSYREQYSPRTASYLEEYINTITSIRTKKILAMSNEVKNLLKDFYDNNEDLIFAAVEAVGDDNLKSKLGEMKGGTQKYHLTLPGSAEAKVVYGHCALAYEVACDLASRHDKNELLSDYGSFKGEKGIGNTYFILTDTSNDFKKRKYTGESIPCEGGEIYCSNQWIPQKIEVLAKKLRNEGIKIQKENNGVLLEL